MHKSTRTDVLAAQGTQDLKPSRHKVEIVANGFLLGRLSPGKTDDLVQKVASGKPTLLRLERHSAFPLLKRKALILSFEEKETP